VLKQLKIAENAQLVYASIDLPSLSQVSLIQSKEETTYSTLQDQILTRDLSFVIGRETQFDQVINAVQETKGVESVKIFDLYQ
jgi:phenylalanyl-tRNA synthetase beta subunit